MYVQINEGLGQQPLSSVRDRQCLEDTLAPRIIDEILINNDLPRLAEFHFRESKLRTRHRVWIKKHFVPSLVKSWQTAKPIRTIALIGRTDEVGDPLTNYKLGLERAKAVRKQIVNEILDQNADLLCKIKIEVFSQGECWPTIRSGKRERRNRSVLVVALDTVLPSVPSSAPSKLVPAQRAQR